MNKTINFVCISDTHGKHRELKTLPKGDVLLFAGDSMTDGYSAYELQDFLDWLEELPYKHKIMIAGNHDHIIEKMPSFFKDLLAERPSITYLENSGTEIEGIKIWGTPDTKEFFNWAFNRTPKQLEKIAAMVPDNTNILLSHGPVLTIRDFLEDGQHVGEVPLWERVKQLKHLQYHVFGHIHNAYGVSGILKAYSHKHYYAINCAVVNEKYQMQNNPIVFGYTLNEQTWDAPKEVETNPKTI